MTKCRIVYDATGVIPIMIVLSAVAHSVAGQDINTQNFYAKKERINNERKNPKSQRAGENVARTR